MDGNKERRMLAASLYPIEGLKESVYRFRVLKVRERIPEDNLRPIRIQRWSDRLWRKVLRCPVYPTSRLGGPAFLIPEENSPPVGNIIEITDVPAKQYHIDVTDQTLEVSAEDASGPERELICRMLERPFTDRFLFLKDRFWKAEWRLFFRIVPENEGVEQDTVNAYRGLKFGVVLLEGVGPYFAADIRTRYVGRKPLSQYTEEEKQSVLQDHLTIPVKDRASFLRDNGPVKIPCRYTGDTGMPVNQCTYDETGETVFQYYQNQYKTIPIEPQENTVFVQDRSKEDRSIPVPISRLFPVFTTEYEGVSHCSTRPQMTPEQRATTIAIFLDCLSGVKYGDRPISIKKNHLTKERTVFVPPRLEFGKGEILALFPKGLSSMGSALSDSDIVNWGSNKFPTLYKAGPFYNEPLPESILLYPTTIDRQTRETFLKNLTQEIRLQTGQQLHVAHQRPYPVNSSELMGSSLLRLAAEIRSNNPRSLAITILWDRFNANVHNDFKETVRPIHSQCVTERTARNICNPSNPQRATSLLRNLALAILIEGGVKPWVLADSLHYDFYIGIDTLYGRIGYHFLYGQGGRLIERDFGESIQRGRMTEAIKEPDLRHRLEESIRTIVNSGHRVKSFIIHRDGRWWPSESTAFHNAVKRLKAENILPADVCCAAVEIRKNHMPVRLFTAIIEDKKEFLRNPLFGTYLILDRQRVLLTTTGRPGAWDRRSITAGTLLVEVVDAIGEIDIINIAEDVYRLSHLNWNAPDIEIGLPVTIRWTDEALRETFHSPAKQEEEEAEWEDETVEINETTGIIDKEEEEP